MTVDELVDKIESEHDHKHDDNYIYAEGWIDACDRFNQELCNKSIVEWHKVEDELPEAWESVLLCFWDELGRFGKLKQEVSHVLGWYRDFDNCFSCGEYDIDVNKVIAWAYLSEYRSNE